MQFDKGRAEGDSLKSNLSEGYVKCYETSDMPNGCLLLRMNRIWLLKMLLCYWLSSLW